MELEMNQEAEMTEETPRVYDLLHPTPVSLKELSAIVTSFEVWRYEMNTYRSRNELWVFCDNMIYWERITLKTMLPDIPPVINDSVEKYTERFKSSMKDWLKYHYEAVFRSYNCRSNCILNDFDDFVTDFKGDIDYVRTAARIMHCDRFDEAVKFRIACIYCFEDDIRRIWPSVCDTYSEDRTWNNVDSYCAGRCPELCYWIGVLTNQLDKTYVYENDIFTTDESMFVTYATTEMRSATEYFWNRLRPEKRLEKASDLLDFDDVCLARFILPKLDDQQLSELVREYGACLMGELLDCQRYKGIAILPTWMYIRNIMNEKEFLNLFTRMLRFVDDNCLYFCTEIWNRAPLNLKQYAVKRFISKPEFINKLLLSIHNDGEGSTKELVKFLLTILPSATLNERNTFWNNSWHYLIRVTRHKYLKQFANLCFENENEIAQFKTNVMANSEHLRQLCISSINEASFYEVKDLLKFCYSEVQQARNFKLELLQLALLGDDSEFSSDIVRNTCSLNEFINEAFADANLSNEFKNVLLMSPAFGKFLSTSIRSTDISDVFKIKSFVDEFQLTEPTLSQVKSSIIDSLKESLIGDGSSRDMLKTRGFNYFLSWCLGSDAEVEEFRRSYALTVVEKDW